MRPGKRRRGRCLLMEQLETRSVPAAPSWAAQFPLDNFTAGDMLSTAPELTLRALPDLGSPSILGDLVPGAIAPGSADVAWYRFTLGSAATVTLTTFDPPGSSFAGVISIYNNDPDALVQNIGSDGFTLYANDPYDPLGHRLLSQSVGTATAGTSLSLSLSAGTYFVAVSGAGNGYFHPFLADSGLPGSSGNFRLAVEANSLNLSGPVLLYSTVNDQSTLASSPLVLRLDLNQAIDPNLLVLNQTSGNTVQLLYSADGNFTTYVQSIFLQAHFSPDPNDPLGPGCNELQLRPSAPLQAGYYQLFLGGIGTIASPNSDTTINFRITGSEATTGDDVAATAHT